MKVKVYWINSGGSVGSDYAVRFTSNEVFFADGGWNALASTFLTAAQARKAARLPDVKSKTRNAAIKAASLMNKAIQSIESALEAEPEST